MDPATVPIIAASISSAGTLVLAVITVINAGAPASRPPAITSQWLSILERDC